MDDTTKEALDSILDTYDAKQKAARQEAERQKTERGVFLDRFLEKSSTVIRPHFQEIGAQLKGRGHDFQIDEQREVIEQDGRQRNAGITLLIFPNGVRPSYPNQDSCPHVAFMVNSYRDNVYVHESTMMPNSGGSAGGAGEYDLDEVTAAIVDKHVVSVLSQAMGRK